MSRTTTLVLGVAVLLMVGVLFVVSGGKSPLRPAGNAGPKLVFPDLLAQDIQAIVLEDSSKNLYSQPVRLEREGQSWRAICSQLQGGRRLRAPLVRVTQIIEALQALSYFRVAGTPESSGLGGFGLAEPQRLSLVLELSGGRSLGLFVGADLEPSDLLVMRQGRGRVLVVDQGVRRDLFPPLASLWDRRLIPLPPTSVTSLVMQPRGEPGMEIVRAFAAWRLRLPFEGRADMQRCDVFRNNIMGLSILRFVDPKKLSSQDLEPRYTVKIKTREPGGETELKFCASSKQGLLCVTSWDPSPVLVSNDIIAHLKRPSSWFRDRRIMRIGEHPVTRVLVEGADHVLEIVRKQNRIYINGGRRRQAKLPSMEIQPELWEDFYRQLNHLQVERFEAQEARISGGFRLLVEQAQKGEEPIRRELRMGPVNAGGELPVSVLGQPGRAFIAESEVEFLQQPWWNLAMRVAGRHISTVHQLARIRIQTPDGQNVLLSARMSAAGRYELLEGEHLEGRLLPAELTDRVATRLQYFSVEKFLGQDLDPQVTGLKRPRLTVSWQISPKGNAQRIPLEGTWQEFLEGSDLSPSLVFGTLTVDKGLVFSLKKDELGPFLRILDWAAK